MREVKPQTIRTVWKILHGLIGHMTITKLSEQIGVDRTTCRHALRILVNEGIVEITPNPYGGQSKLIKGIEEAYGSIGKIGEIFVEWKSTKQLLAAVKERRVPRDYVTIFLIAFMQYGISEQILLKEKYSIEEVGDMAADLLSSLRERALER